MKQKIFSKILLSLAAVSFYSQALATSQVGLACPHKYIATVVNVEDVAAGDFPKIEVDFQIIQTIKGEKVSSKKIQIIKDGPVHFKSGEVYTLESRENWLCSASVFSKI